MSRELQPARNSIVHLSAHKSNRHDPRKRAETLVRSLAELRRNGSCYEIKPSIPDIVATAQQTRKAGHPMLAARLFTELAHTTHIYGELEEAEQLLQAAIKAGDFVGEDVMNDITRLRAMIALDRRDPSQAAEIISLADRPILIHSATVVREMIEGRGWMTRRDDSEAGERVREKEGAACPATMLIEAEILMSADDHARAHQQLSRIGQKLVHLEVADRNLDDMAMLALLLTLSHERLDAGALDILNDLVEHWQGKGASAPVISKMRAAAGDRDEILLRSINHFERDRFHDFGTAARAMRLAPRPPSQPTATVMPFTRPEPPSQRTFGNKGDDIDPHATDPSAITDGLTDTPGSATAEVEAEERPLDFASFTDQDIDNLFVSMTDQEPQNLRLRGETPDTGRPEDAQTPSQPRYNWQIGPGASDLYSMINVIENSRSTGCMSFTLEHLWAKVYFQLGRVAYAEHHAQSETPYEAFRQLCQWSEATEHLIQVEFHPTEGLDTPLELLENYHSNAQLILMAITGVGDLDQERVETESQAPSSVGESREAPASFKTLASSNHIPSRVMAALDAILDARSTQELATLITDHCEGLGARGTRTRILIGQKPTTLALSTKRATDAKADAPRITLVESPPINPTNLRVSIEAVEPPPGEYLPALSVIARTARAAAELLPEKPKSNLPDEPEEEDASSGLVWKSSAMFDVITTIRNIAPMDGLTLPIASVLITGETGTGKDKIARYIHDRSGRRDRPFQPINCAAIPKDLFEAEIFGHRKGAFTGAVEDKPGLIEMADGGTIFFTEFAEVPRDVQAKLLSVLDTEGQYTRLGEAHRIRQANVRFIFGTNRNVRDQDIMRIDIFHRCPGKIHLKPLRDRRDDIPVLARFFASRYGLKLSDAALKYLEDLDWPGNIRELQNTLQMATATSAPALPLTADQLRAAWLKTNPPVEQDLATPPGEIIPRLAAGHTLKQMLNEYEEQVFRAAYERYGGNIEKIVSVSGMSKNPVRKILTEYGIHQCRGYAHRSEDTGN